MARRGVIFLLLFFFHHYSSKSTFDHQQSTVNRTEDSDGPELYNYSTIASGEASKLEDLPACPVVAAEQFPEDPIGQELRAKGLVIVHFLIACYIFFAITVVCDAYFLPALDIISHKLKLREDIAGATFMAFGSSSPELFASLIGVFIAKGDVGTGTIVGSAAFNVLGAIGIVGLCVKSVPLKPSSVMRDFISYALSLFVLLWAMWDNVITITKSVVMLLLYALFVISVVYTDQVNRFLSYLFIRSETGGAPKEGNEEPSKTEDTSDFITSKWAKCILTVVEFPLTVLTFFTIPDCRKYKNLFPVTFMMSLCWLAMLSYVMVWMVCVIGVTFGIPDSVMGITLLAAGASVPDTYSSVQVGRAGRGDMAVSNVLGSNTFDILVGLALPWFLQTAIVNPGSTIIIMSDALFYGVLLLFICQAAAIIAFMFNNWTLNPRIGTMLMICYATFVGSYIGIGTLFAAVPCDKSKTVI